MLQPSESNGFLVCEENKKIFGKFIHERRGRRLYKDGNGSKRVETLGKKCNNIGSYLYQ